MEIGDSHLNFLWGNFLILYIGSKSLIGTGGGLVTANSITGSATDVGLRKQNQAVIK